MPTPRPIKVIKGHFLRFLRLRISVQSGKVDLVTKSIKTYEPTHADIILSVIHEHMLCARSSIMKL
jgi:hypothetical protein